ncbi:MAG: hypothetical protein ABMA64_31640 [Myxococcota bacterium]
MQTRPHVLQFTRWVTRSAPSTWVREGVDLPGRPVSAVGVRTVHVPFVAERR